MKTCWSFLAARMVCTVILAQAQQEPPRPESFEWDHQIRLWTEAYNNENYAEAERLGRRSRKSSSNSARATCNAPQA